MTEDDTIDGSSVDPREETWSGSSRRTSDSVSTTDSASATVSSTRVTVDDIPLHDSASPILFRIGPITIRAAERTGVTVVPNDLLVATAAGPPPKLSAVPNVNVDVSHEGFVASTASLGGTIGAVGHVPGILVGAVIGAIVGEVRWQSKKRKASKLAPDSF